MASIHAGLPEHDLSLNVKEEPLVMVSNTAMRYCTSTIVKGVHQKRKSRRRIFASKDNKAEMYFLAIDFTQVSLVYVETSQ